MRLSAAVLFALFFTLSGGEAGAQPAPSFQARCSEIKESMATLKSRGQEELVTIEVVGTLEIVREEGGLAFLGLCGPPHPRVLCITYETDGRQVGDRVVVIGSVHPADEDFIQVDPCLHYTPTPEDKD